MESLEIRQMHGVRHKSPSIVSALKGAFGKHQQREDSDVACINVTYECRCRMDLARGVR
jgi:hypothetical protein